MRKIAMAVLFGILFGLSIVAHGEDGLISEILESAKPCALWDFEDNRLLGGIAISVIDYHDMVSLDFGGITDMSSNAFLVGISCSVDTIAEKYGMDFNLPERVGIGFFTARDFSNEDWLYGLSLSYKIEW